jgi:hypothetical protein
MRFSPDMADSADPFIPMAAKTQLLIGFTLPWT